MLDRRIRYIGTKKGYDYLFSSVTPLFRTADVVIANLEGPVTTNPSKTLLPSGVTTDNMSFTFAPSSVQALSNAGITAVSLANNHEDNFGAAGVAETKQWLAKSGVQWFGSPWNVGSSSLVVNSKGMKIAFVGYHSFQSGIENVLADIKRLSADGDFVIVMPHWGPEYVSEPTIKMRDDARRFVAAGAKAVIGSARHHEQRDYRRRAGILFSWKPDIRSIFFRYSSEWRDRLPKTGQWSGWAELGQHPCLWDEVG